MRVLKRSLWVLPILLAWAATGVQSCSARLVDPARAPEPPPPTLNHARHQQADLLCADCHDPEETGAPSIPKAESCFECHEDLSKENERVNAYFDAVRQPDGSYVFPKRAYSPDLVMNHESHAKVEIGCAECHGEVAETGFTRPPLLELKANCMGCHRERNASLDCATCHREIREDRKPPDHDALFLGNHGKKAPEGWQTGEGATCALCHAVPQDCNACHMETPPSSHREAGFRLLHGKGETDALEQPFGETSCALCHQEQACVLCHQTEAPRSHTTVWKRRHHGIQAMVERQSCQVCHKQDFCASCHQTTEPVSHRGSFGSGQQSHCLACHEPLQATSCFVCHKSTLGHLQATTLPVNAAHLTASDPTDCESCHPVLPHLNDGGRCRRCHR